MIGSGNHETDQGERPSVFLAVDDIPEHLELIRELIKEQLPHTDVMVTTNAEEGLRMAAEFQPDGILLDVHMPVLSGIEMCKRLKAQKRTAHIPVILITSYRVEPRFKAEGLEAGADDFISKPIEDIELAAKIKVILRIKRAEDQLRKINENLERLVRQKTEALIQGEEKYRLLFEERTKELRESEEKFKTLSEKSMVGIYIIQGSEFKYMNPAFAQIFDYPLNELVKKCFHEIVFPGDRKKIKEKIHKLMAGKIDYSHSQFKGVQKNGEVLFLEVYKARINLDNHPAVIGTLIDITRRVHFEEALQEKSTQLENLNRDLESRINTELEKRRKHEQILVQQSKLAAMGEMVGAIAHQWRQPLTTVGITIQNLKMAHRLNKLTAAVMEKFAKDAMEQIRFMSKTIDDFRNFFKPSKAKEVFPIIKAVEETISIVRSQLENNFIKIQCLYDKAVSCRASGYPNEFKQVLVNIFNNARNAILERRQKGLMEEDSGCISIDIFPGYEEIVIKISNNGGGIPGKIINRIFEPYFTTRKTGKSMGIGLYMSKIIIEEEMGGRIYAENSKDSAIFTIVLKV